MGIYVALACCTSNMTICENIVSIMHYGRPYPSHSYILLHGNAMTPNELARPSTAETYA